MCVHLKFPDISEYIFIIHVTNMLMHRTKSCVNPGKC